MTDGSSKTLMVDETQTVRDILDNLFEKTHCDCNIDWTLFECSSDLQIERGFEDHENLVELLSQWTRDSENKIIFVERKEKYAVFKNPQNFYLGKKEKKEMKDKDKESLLEDSFCGTSLIVPDLEGALYLKEDGKRSWKRRYFLLRASGIYYVPKGKTKTSRDLACFIQFENVNVYYGTDYKNKYKAPTDFCFVLKHPQIQKESQYVKYLCCDDKAMMELWVTGIRIAKELFISKLELKSLCDYYFDGKGKAFRPMIVVLMARACNLHSKRDGDLLPCQRSIAMISEMIHTASLVHDDVIDGSDTRRGKTTINEIWGERKAILAGDFILSAASMALARIGNNTVVAVLSQVIEDLVRGEFMQLGSKENENERFKHYLEKTFKKTASLIANSCKAVSILVSSDPEVHEVAFQYGKNVGIAFQLIDDVLDFTSCANQLGKPSAADLRLGLATGPVLFACQQFPELHVMIMRRFNSAGDVENAWKYVLQSDGVQQTNYLAQRYCQEAIRQISKLHHSPERDALIQLTEIILTRNK
ncbi:DPS1 synthase, partial [Amia calva]|nr:DPS1 synthase [Amia calva]